jgi:hypothetical protein
MPTTGPTSHRHRVSPQRHPCGHSDRRETAAVAPLGDCLLAFVVASMMLKARRDVTS